MPAWIAGIQIRKDAFGDIRVNLDSSTPCWNDAVERSSLNSPKPACPIFSKKKAKFRIENFPNLLGLGTLRGAKTMYLSIP